MRNHFHLAIELTEAEIWSEAQRRLEEICHETPYLSFSQPQAFGLPPPDLSLRQ